MDEAPVTARDAFRHYLRTGRRVPAHRIVQVKFNPYHDPKNGQFTFKNGVGGSANMSQPPKKPQQATGREDPRIVAGDRAIQQRAWAANPQNPANQDSYTVKPGDTLTHIAATRVGLTVEDLAWLNQMSQDAVIKAGQSLVLPTQAYLDKAKKGFDTAVALETYMQSHGGRLPPNVAHPPSLAEQMFGPGTHEVNDNGYQFTIDGEGRTRLVSGTVTLNSDQKRSKQNQLAAGGSDRLPTDEGGHYIARQFDGPTEAYNHFAQDADFNRSGYRKLENLWAAATRRGEKVHVTIGAEYSGASKRPYAIDVEYTIARLTKRSIYPNRSRY